jgi:hypothetical protein
MFFYYIDKIFPPTAHRIKAFKPEKRPQVNSRTKIQIYKDNNTVNATIIADFALLSILSLKFCPFPILFDLSAKIGYPESL